MKGLIIILLTFVTINASGTNYYVSNTGSDAANGLTTGTAWQTIAKVNAQTFSPGDSILFQAGGTWTERLVPPSSGTLALPIIFASYGVGNKPIINGLQTLSMTDSSGNYWTATATNAVKQLNTVTIGGTLRAMARTPNSGFLTMTSSSGLTQITTTLTGTPNYTGGNVVIKTAHWLLDRNRVTSQATGVLNFTPGITYPAPLTLGGGGFFMQNSFSDLDVQNEWQYDSATKILRVYSTTTPTVQISIIDTLVWISKKNYITLYGLSLIGSNKVALQIDTCLHTTINNCSITTHGRMGILSYKSTGVRVVNDSLQNILSNSVFLSSATVANSDYSDSAIVDSNYLHNIAFLEGMGGSGNARYEAISITGGPGGPDVGYNRIDTVGYIPIKYYGLNSTIHHNYITYFCYIKSDGGGIYTEANISLGSEEKKNIILHGIGNDNGASGQPGAAAGIYCDNNPVSLIIDSNSIKDCYVFAVIFNQPTTGGYMKFFGNTVDDSTGTDMWIQNTISNFGFNSKNNIFYNRNNAKFAFILTNVDSSLVIDSNYYLKPVNDAVKMQLVLSQYSLAQWQANTNFDVHSKSTPILISSNSANFVYNPTGHDSTIVSPGYLSAKGFAHYPGSIITLKPYTSLILFYTPIWGTIIKRQYKKVIP